MGDTRCNFVCRRRGVIMTSLALPLSRVRADTGSSCNALLIGNSRYQRNAMLPNAGNDTRLIEQALREAGVEVEAKFDLTRQELDATLRRFLDRARKQPGTPVWISFAGHGVQLDGKNYLQGVDSDFSSPQQIRAAGYDLDELLYRLQEAGPVAAVVTLDACRNNPFKPETTRGADTGFAPVEAAGVLVAFSTAAYMRALDGPAASNSPYAKALAKALKDRPATLEQVFRNAADAVYRSTNHLQVPEYRTSLRIEWRFGTRQVELSLLPTSMATATGAQGPGRSAGYRPDLLIQADGAWRAMTPEQWIAELERIQYRADHADAREARQLLARGRVDGAPPFDVTLAALLLNAGRVTARDRLVAIDLYERAAVRGHAAAQLLLGELLYERRDYSVAYKWLSAAADHGLPRARLDLAQMKFEGRGTTMDVRGALDLFKQSMPSTTPTAQDKERAIELMRALRGSAVAPAR